MLDETQELQLIRSVLVDALPEESQRVGKANLNDIVRRRGQVRVVPLSRASKLEWTDSLVLLASSATLLSQWLIIARNDIDLRDRTREEWHIHFNQNTRVTQDVRVDRVQASQVSVSNGFNLPVPSEMTGKLDPAVLDKLISSFVAHLEAVNAQGSSSREPE